MSFSGRNSSKTPSTAADGSGGGGGEEGEGNRRPPRPRPSPVGRRPSHACGCVRAHGADGRRWWLGRGIERISFTGKFSRKFPGKKFYRKIPVKPNMQILSAKNVIFNQNTALPKLCLSMISIHKSIFIKNEYH